MAIEDIKNTILAEAKKTVSQIEIEGDKKIAVIKADWDQKIQAKKASIVDQATKKVNQKIQQTNFKIQTQNQTEVTKKKQKIIDQVYQQALEKLTNLTDNQYIDLMTKLIKELPEVDGEIISAQNKTKLLKKALAQSGKKYKVAAEEIKAQGGFILKSVTVEIDNTFAALAKNIREKTLTEVCNLLFTQSESD